MTNEKILELAKSCGFDVSIGKKENFWECWEEQLIEFARQIHKNTLNELKEWLPENKTEIQENSNDLIFYTNGEETFRISLQHFGPGNICPETKLEIEKND